MITRGGIRRNQRILVKVAQSLPPPTVQSPGAETIQSKQSAASYLAVGLLGASLSALALFVTGWWQSGAQLSIARDNVNVELQKIALEEKKLSADREKTELERARFEYSKDRDAETTKSTIANAARQKLAEDLKRQWDRQQLNKSIELQNNSLLAQAWFACLSATAMVRQPVAIAPNSGIMASTGSVQAGPDSIKCQDKFKDFNLSAFATALVP